MKVIFFTAIFTGMFLLSQAQGFQEITYVILDKKPADSSFLTQRKFRQLTVYDSAKGRVASLFDDGSIEVKDSLASIKALMTMTKEYTYASIKSMWYERFSAAAEILNHLYTNGTVSNRKKFDKAVKKYRKLMNAPER